MKKLVVTLMVMLIASCAMAGAYVDWFCASGFFANGTDDSLVNTVDPNYPYGNLGVGQSVLWALMYTTEASYGDADATTVGATSTVQLEDTILATRYFAAGWSDMSDMQMANGVGYDPGLFRIGGGQTSDDSFQDAAYTSGNIYQAVFANVVWDGTDMTFTDASIFYVFTGFTGLVNKDLTADPLPLAQDLPSGSTYSGVVASSVINAVPEPATMGLLGLGALVMAIRRRRS